VGGQRAPAVRFRDHRKKSAFPFACKGLSNISGNSYAPVEMIQGKQIYGDVRKEILLPGDRPGKKEPSDKGR